MDSFYPNGSFVRPSLTAPSACLLRYGRRLACRTVLLGAVTILGMSVLTASAQVRIGNEAQVALPTSAHYSSAVNVRPGNGEVVSFNPPIFSWFYNTNHLVGVEMNPNGWPDTIWMWTNAFQFQVATQANFGGTLAVDVTTPVNFYNFLSPLDTSATRQFWWRVKYIRNGTPYWTNAYTFTVANGATNWDRSLLASTNYLATNAVHPFFCFRAGQQASIYAWMQTQPEFAALMNLATLCTNDSWFKNHAEWPLQAGPNPSYAAYNPPDAYVRVNRLGAVLTLWALSGENRWTNASMTGWLVTNLAHVVNWYNSPSNNLAMVDYAMPASSVELPRLITATYDWMYHYLGADTSTFNGRLRTNALLGLERTMMYYTHNMFWQDAPYTGGANFRLDWAYPRTTENAPWSGLAKLGISHFIADVHCVLPVALVIQNESAHGRFAFNWMVNYMLARSSPYAGFAAHHVGPYGYADNHTYTGGAGNMFNAFMQLSQAYPEAGIEKTDFARRFPDWWTRMNPYRMRKYHGPYGDGSPAHTGNHSGFLGARNRGWDLAAFSRSGLAMQAYNLNAEFFAAPIVAEWNYLPLRWHFTNTPAPVTNTTSAVYPEDGYVIASSKSPSLFDCYTNGVGFSLQARPRGSTSGHDTYSDLSFDLWAYGTQLTDGGGMWLDAYGYTAAAAPTLFVNGYGAGDYGIGVYGYSPVLPAIASIAAFTNSGTNFVYACADGTGMFTNKYHPQSNVVTKVRRHILFPRSKYWVIYDEFGTRTPATFAFRWHIPWAFRYSAGSALANETVFSGNRIGSNSLAMTPNGFTYVAGNHADASYPNPPRIPVHVQFANAPSTYGVFNAVGVNSLGVGTANARGTSATNSTFNPFLNRTYATVNPDRAVGMWVTNRVAATNWSLMTVIVPQQKGVAAPIIERLDDTTVAVTYDGVTETNTFGTNYTGAFTYRVEYAGPRSKLNVQVPQGVRVAPPGQ